MKKRILSAFLLVTCLLALAACGSKTLSGAVTIKQWLAAEGVGDDFTMTVTVKEIENPVYAVVEDSTGSVHLFGVVSDGEFKDFESAGIRVGDTIRIANGRYNLYEGQVEIADAVLVR